MDAKSKQELASIKKELKSIIKELEDIAKDVRADSQGIGEEKCGAGIDRVVDKYEYVHKKLSNIDTSKLAEGFKNAAKGLL